MTAATASREGFMAPAPQNAAALPWLADASSLQKDKTQAWVKALRETGAETFARTGLPTVSWEGWQYTNLRALGAGTFRYSAEPVKFDATKIPAALAGCKYRVVLVNGQFQSALSSVPEHVTVMSLMDAADGKLDKLEDHVVRLGELADHPLVALNSAYLRDGFVLSVARNRDIEEPIEVLFFNTGKDAAIYPRVLYRVGENAGATIIERHFGVGAYLSNAYVAIAQESASRFKYYRFLDESTDGFHLSQTVLQSEKDAQFEGFSIATGGRVARQEFRMLLIDKAISSSIGGAYLMKGQQSHDFTVLADHFEPGGRSVQNFRGVTDDQARAVFQGKIHVRRNAQKTDGYQSHHALLLSPTSEASAKPELEIYADDVKCSHGATAGQLDPVALFYLRSRGLTEADARALLVESFVNNAILTVTNEAVRELCFARVSEWLAGRAS